jgi:hypothetical protein
MKIEEVRELLGDLPTEMPSFLSDGTIRRFLRAKNWSMEQATKALKEASSGGVSSSQKRFAGYSNLRYTSNLNIVEVLLK